MLQKILQKKRVQVTYQPISDYILNANCKCKLDTCTVEIS